MIKHLNSAFYAFYCGTLPQMQSRTEAGRRNSNLNGNDQRKTHYSASLLRSLHFAFNLWRARSASSNRQILKDTRGQGVQQMNISLGQAAQRFIEHIGDLLAVALQQVETGCRDHHIG